MPSQEMPQDDDQSTMQQFSLTNTMPHTTRKLRGKKKMIPIHALEGNSTINSSNAFLREESALQDMKFKKSGHDHDLESLFTDDSKDAIVQKIKEKQKNDKNFWWRD